MEMHERLRKARIDAGFTSAAEAARRLGIPYGTYSGHENGQRGIKWDEVRKYSKLFRVSTGWLSYGLEQVEEGSDVKIPAKPVLTTFSGVIQSGGLVEEVRASHGVTLKNPYDRKIQSIAAVHFPWFLSETSAVLFLAHNDFAPLAGYGDVIAIGEEEIKSDFEDWIYKTALCATAEGNLWFREIQPSARKGRFNLYSHSSPPVMEQKIIYIQEFRAVLKHDILRSGNLKGGG